jgi:signal transduction histidine kinase
MKAGRLTIEHRAFDLCVTVEDTLHLLAGAAHRKGIELIGEITSSIPARLLGDPGRLQQILTLLSTKWLDCPLFFLDREPPPLAITD